VKHIRGFVSAVDGSHCRVVLLGWGEGLPDAQWIQERKSAARSGLDGVLFISPQTRGNPSMMRKSI
jgi:hypothetical protein